MNLDNVRQLRDRSHAPLNECRSALQEAEGDVEKALVVLQKRGVLRAQASAAREAREGVVHSYVHNGKIAVLVEVNCETDFAARNPLFRAFVDSLAMHIAAVNPQFLDRDSVADQHKRIQSEIFATQLPKGKPEPILQKILDGKMDKWYAEACLMEQASVVAGGDRTIEQLRAELASQLGENIVVRRFTRWELGS
jgi:elongation factor Ts